MDSRKHEIIGQVLFGFMATAGALYWLAGFAVEVRFLGIDPWLGLHASLVTLVIALVLTWHPFLAIYLTVLGACIWAARQNFVRWDQDALYGLILAIGAIALMLLFIGTVMRNSESYGRRRRFWDFVVARELFAPPSHPAEFFIDALAVIAAAVISGVVYWFTQTWVWPLTAFLGTYFTYRVSLLISSGIPDTR